MQQPRRLPIHRSLNQQSLIMGCDRGLLGGSAILCAALVFVGLSTMTFFIGLTLWLISVYFFRKMAKADPQMKDVYFRHVKYRPYYRARSSAWRTR